MARSDTSNSSIRLNSFYDFQAKEFVLRFESRSQAVAYQSKNNEARILSSQGRMNDVWLPVSPDMKYLRSSSLGMAVVFESEEAAKRWQSRTILGEFVTFEGVEAGVYFPRAWTPEKLKNKIGDFRASLGPLGYVPTPPTRQVSPSPQPYQIHVGLQRGSEKMP